MNKLSFLFSILLAGVVMFTTSCGTQGSADGFEQSESGLMYKFHVKGDGTVSPVEGDFLDVIMVYGLEDSILFDSRDIPDQQQRNVPMMASVHKADIYEGLAMMHVGDSATFKLVADSVWLKLFRMPKVPPGMDSVDYIYFHVTMNEIINAEEMQAKQEEEQREFREAEKGMRDAYLAANYPDATPTESGLYYIRTNKGSGAKPVPGQTVLVHYTGMLVDGTKFDSSVDRGTPFEFTLGEGRVIQGWDEGLAMMQKGDKGILVIPSDLGYGSRGTGIITPFSTLVFEVELIDFKNAE